MSSKIAGLVLDHGPREHGPMIILLLLAERARTETWVCWPSRRDLEERGRMSSASVTRHLRTLEREGWIARRKRFNQSTVFRVNVPRLLERAAKRESERKTPRGFEPFDEEIAAQAIEKKGNDQGDHPSDHCEHPSDHGEHLNLSLTSKEKRSSRTRAAAHSPAPRFAASRAASSGSEASGRLTPFKLHQLRKGEPVWLDNHRGWLRPESPEAVALLEAERAGRAS